MIPPFFRTLPAFAAHAAEAAVFSDARYIQSASRRAESSSAEFRRRFIVRSRQKSHGCGSAEFFLSHVFLPRLCSHFRPATMPAQCRQMSFRRWPQPAASELMAAEGRLSAPTGT